MEIQHLHDWQLTPKEAIQLQTQLAAQLIDQPLNSGQIQTIAGVDVSVKNNVSKAAVVVMDMADMRIIETQTAVMPTPFPYVPGLLTFREGPVLEMAFSQLQTVADVFLFDGMGRIHPRRIGIAAHMGLWLNHPTIGCGKTHFIGDYTMPAESKGSYSDLTDRGQTIGVVLRTRDRVKPVYISPGHLCDIDSAMAITLRCTSKYRLPDPIRAAHNAAGTL